MSVELKKKTCETMGCRVSATHVLSTPGLALDTDDEKIYVDYVCLPCGQGYMRRPALRATLEPLGGVPATDPA